jgi:hypothetical protein
VYSLVSAPVLGFDLTRLQGGSAAADVLLRGLSLTVGDIDVLARSTRLDTWQRAELWQDVEVAAGQLRSVREAAGPVPAADSADNVPPADAAANELVRALAVVERAPIGNLDGLLHCARHDVLAWTWQESEFGPVQSEPASLATAVLCDALAAAYLRDSLSVPTRRKLAAGWVTAARGLSEPAPDLGPQQKAIQGLLRRVRTASPTDVQRLSRSAGATRRGINDWAPAVHSASWAVYLADRLRPAAAAQLMLVQAVEDGGVPVPERAAGVWNMLSGAVQALVVRDLLDSATIHRLLNPYLSALGPAGLD